MPGWLSRWWTTTSACHFLSTFVIIVNSLYWPICHLLVSNMSSTQQLNRYDSFADQKKSCDLLFLCSISILSYLFLRFLCSYIYSSGWPVTSTKIDYLSPILGWWPRGCFDIHFVCLYNWIVNQFTIQVQSIWTARRGNV